MTKEIHCIESIFGDLTNNNTPIKYGDHKNMDTSRPMNDEEYHIYHILIDIMNWVLWLGSIDVWLTVSSLSRFPACPRKGHLDWVMTVFGYQNKNKNRRVVVDSSDQILVGGINELDKDYNNIFL